MSLKVNAARETAFPKAAANAADNDFTKAVEEALGSRTLLSGKNRFADTSGITVISRKFEQKMKDDPALAEETARRLNEMLALLGGKKDSIIIIDRSGELSEYSPSSEKNRNEHPTREELREIEKARKRRLARLEDYFKLVRQNAVKRKLIEEENLRRPKNKRYRRGGTYYDTVAQSILQKPTRSEGFIF